MRNVLFGRKTIRGLSDGSPGGSGHLDLVRRGTMGQAYLCLLLSRIVETKPGEFMMQGRLAGTTTYNTNSNDEADTGGNYSLAVGSTYSLITVDPGLLWGRQSTSQIFMHPEHRAGRGAKHKRVRVSKTDDSFCNKGTLICHGFRLSARLINRCSQSEAAA
jgi:hypothetical protein